jgi:hypothetical protein
MKYLQFLSKQILLLGFLCISLTTFSQDKHPSKKAKTDTLKKPASKPIVKLKDDAIKPYKTVIHKNTITHNGLFAVHQLRDTVYFEIPDSILNRPIEVINRLEKVPPGLGFYAGENINETTIKFEKHPSDSTIRIIYDLVVNTADSTNAISKAVQNSSENPVIVSFPIKAYGNNHKSYVIDVTHFLKSPSSFLNNFDRSQFEQRIKAANIEQIVIEAVHAYPINVELSISKNEVIKPTGPSDKGSQITIQTKTSFVELPEQAMQPRIFDERVGLFTTANIYHFDDHQQKVEKMKFITRLRLEPRNEDLAKWKLGEIVEPKRPIVIYIDPNTPKQWRPYLIAGINDWQKAFEQAGFKNAIIGKEWPENDSTMHKDDARYSFINYLPSDIENAYGPHVADPRSGEIIQTQIGWYHNVMELLHNWYMVQAGATDPKARHAIFDEELMGQLIRFVSSHEVGHTLGLTHNMGSSSLTPVDSLRSKHYLDINGHTASIMDYARFNYVAQPEDNIPENDLFPRIGDYDKWAIEWAYKNSNAQNLEEDKLITQKWATIRIRKNPRLWFGGEGNALDPRSRSEDLGDNAMKASTYGIKNLQRILPNLPEWTKESGGNWDNLATMYNEMENQYQRYLNHVLANIGGVYITARCEEETDKVGVIVPKAKQQEALAFFDKQLFTTPYWLMNKSVIEKADPLQSFDFVGFKQVAILNELLSINTINKLQKNVKQYGKTAYPIDEYIAAIHKSIWKELRSNKPEMDIYKRNLQKAYLSNLQNIFLAGTTDNTDAYSVIRNDLLSVQKEITLALPKVSGKLDRYHLQDLEVRIKKTLDAPYKKGNDSANDKKSFASESFVLSGLSN